MFGRTLLSSTGNLLRVSADGRPEYKAGGMTIDWNTVVAAPSDVALGDGTPIKAGQKYLRYGQVLTKIGLNAVDTITIGGGASGGTFVIPITVNGGTPVSTAPITYSSGLTAATVQAAIQAASNVGSGNATVTGSNGGTLTAEVNTFTPGTATAGDTISVSDANGVLIEIVVGATPTATTITTQLKQAWNASAALTARATASGTATFILTAVTPGVSLGLTAAIQGTGTFTNVVTAATVPFTVTFANSLGPVSIGTISPASLTGGTPTATVTQTAPGGDYGFFGPYDPAATDGRAALARGDCVVLDETVLQYRSGSSLLSAPSDVIGGGIEGGSVWRARLLITASSHSLAAGPTVSEFEAAFPRISYFKN